MSGASLPVPYKQPSVSQEFEGNGMTGTVQIVPNGASVTQSFVTVTIHALSVNSFRIELASGDCGAFTGVYVYTMTSYMVADDSYTYTVPMRATELADGGHVLVVTPFRGLQVGVDPDPAVCLPLVDIPNGANVDQMIDADCFTPYGVSLRDVSADTVEAYVPIVSVKDAHTNDRVAFSARMPYWPDDPTEWGNYHEVRLVWLLMLL
ncbi:MAG: hypothetical protein NTZ50_10840, partial [Chloroflexi bacterium]|nr:hypothetical protein [Chloroflexota bacterium]